GVPTILNTGNGNDSIIVANNGDTLDPIQGPLTINGQGGSDSLTINDNGSTTAHIYNLTGPAPNGSLLRSGAALISWTDIQTFTLNKGPSSAPLARDLTLSKKVEAGEPATLSGRLDDADPAAVLSLMVDWGDGSQPETSTPDRAPFAVTHTYAQPGTYTVHVTWMDSTGLSNSQELTITVKPAKKAGPGGLLAPFGQSD